MICPWPRRSQLPSSAAALTPVVFSWHALTDWCCLPGCSSFQSQDMSAIDFPSLQEDTNAMLEKWSSSLTGVDDMAREQFTGYMMELGTSKKDSAAMIDFLIMAVLEKSQGEKVLTTCLDCGPVTHTPLN